MRHLLCASLLVVATAQAAPHKVSATGFTVMAVEGWEDKTTGAEVSLMSGTDVVLRAMLMPALAERASKAAKVPAECAAFVDEFAKSMSAEGAKATLATTAKRAMCEVTATLGGNAMLGLVFPVGKSAGLVLCIATSKASPDKRFGECRAMAASLAIDAKAAPAAGASYTTSKLARGGTRVVAGTAQLDVPAGWVVKDGTAGQLFAATKGNTALSLRRVDRVFKGDTEDNCKKLAAAAGAQANATGDARILKLRPGNACLVTVETSAFTNAMAYVNVPGAQQHVLFACVSTDNDQALIRECGTALGTISFH